MSEPTITLQNLRRAIARELEMPFFKRYKNGFLDADSGETDELVDTDLTQKDKFWNGCYFEEDKESKRISSDANIFPYYLEIFEEKSMLKKAENWQLKDLD